jgi:ABC-type sugar transport system, periplasmic component
LRAQRTGFTAVFVAVLAKQFWQKQSDRSVKWAFRLFRLIALAAALASPAQAATEINWWHAMSGELGKQLEKLAADFNASQSDYRIVPSYKGNYTETVTSAIFAFRSRSQPAIVQVNEIATAP